VQVAEVSLTTSISQKPQMQRNSAINIVGLLDGQPRILNLKEIAFDAFNSVNRP